jgi:cytochrome c biogenesis protein
VTFIPQNPTTFYSEGADEIRGAANADGVHTNDIGISGFFAPTAEETSAGVYTSIAPQATNPILGLFVYKGDVGNDGVPRSVYSLDATQISTGKLKKIGAVNLKLGQSQTLSGVSVKFVGYRQWASMQVSHDPSQDYLLIAAVAMVIGLIGSLGVRRRRLWIRIVPPVQGAVETPRTVVQVGGLARSDSGNFTDEFAGLVQRLRTSVDGTEPAPAPDEKG